ncbi:MAG: hypothetical protein N2510_06405 [Ignavibacteria bacterium]|nr:hypothetical protein [Ignavibacteria bacterium]
MKKIILIFIFQCSIYASGDSLIGVWQDMKVLGSAWSNTYIFFPDKSFKFFYNQMDCEKRIVSLSGTWSLIEEDVINFYVFEKYVIEGGKLVPAEGSCASDSMIVEGYEKVYLIDPPEVMDYSISRIYKDNEDDLQRDVIYIDAIKFWRMRNDPYEVMKEFEK